MTLLHDVRLITMKSGSVGSFDDGSLVIANARIPVIQPSFHWANDKIPRERVRATIGDVEPTPGKNLMEINFGVELKGSGTGGTAPAIGQALIGCGFLETVQNGSAVTGPAIANPANIGQNEAGAGVPGPVLTSGGTFLGAKNGKYHITLESKVTSTSVTFRWYFQPDDGTAGSTGTWTATDGSANVVDDAMTIAIPDPTATEIGTNYRVGDRWVLNMTSDQSAAVLYTPTNEQSVQDIGFYHNGRLFKIHSARGTCQASHVNGSWTRVDFSFMGICDNPVGGSPGYVDEAILSGIDWEDTVAPPCMGVTYTHGGQSRCWSQFDWDLGAEIAMRECATEPTGYKEARNTRRRMTGSVNHEAELKADFNPFDKYINGGTDAVVLTQGDEAGNIIDLNFPNAVTTDITDQERDGISVDALTMAFVEPDFDAGGDYDEVKLTFT